MIPRIPLPVDQLSAPPFTLFDKQWFLLTAGDFNEGKYNTMTISWGFLGTMWNRPVVQVVVRPQRYTLEFMEQYPTFTLCAFSAEHRRALNLLGTVSGRTRDKIKDSGLTPRAAQQAGAPVFAEAELTLECRKICWQVLNPAGFVDPTIDQNYARGDYHRIYWGEVIAASATPAWARRS